MLNTCSSKAVMQACETVSVGSTSSSAHQKAAKPNVIAWNPELAYHRKLGKLVNGQEKAFQDECQDRCVMIRVRALQAKKHQG
jgi:hypothetical protein